MIDEQSETLLPLPNDPFAFYNVPYDWSPPVFFDSQTTTINPTDFFNTDSMNGIELNPENIVKKEGGVDDLRDLKEKSGILTKEEDEDGMDDDKLMKEKRQLRNKISARNFRMRRKEYITTLEDEVRKYRQVTKLMKNEVDKVHLENRKLKTELSFLKTKLSNLSISDSDKEKSEEEEEEEEEIVKPTSALPSSTTSSASLYAKIKPKLVNATSFQLSALERRKNLDQLLKKFSNSSSTAKPIVVEVKKELMEEEVVVLKNTPVRNSSVPSRIMSGSPPMVKEEKGWLHSRVEVY